MSNGLTHHGADHLLEEYEGSNDDVAQNADILGYAGKELRELTDEEVKSVIAREIEDSLGGLSSEISEQRRLALRYYLGKPYGNEIEGRSSVVLTDVSDVVEWSMPNLMLMLADSDTIFRFHATKQEEEEQAHQATAYVNHVLMNECDGYNILYEWFKTGLIEKNGFVKAYIEERIEPKVDTYEGLDEEEMNLILSHEGVTPLEMTGPYQKSLGAGPDGMPQIVQCWDLRVRVEIPERRIRIDGIPPEECLTARRMIHLDEDVQFMGHRKKTTVSNLIAMGYPPEVVLNLPSDDTPEYEQARVERLSEDETFPVTTAERADPASREIWMTECYLRMDYDGDGYSELRKVTVVGESSITILDNEEINWNPFAALCPIPMPHKFYGRSLSDLVADLQLIRSTLLRQSLDNVYLTNNSRLAVVEGQANLDDLMVSRPGGLVRVRSPDAITPLQVQPLGSMAMDMMEFLEGVKENRTGITKYNQGLDSSSLNKTATGVNRVMNASYARLQSIAKIYAQTGMKRLGKLLLRLMVEGGFKERVVKLRGKWVSVDPSTWNANMDCTVEVGMGVGQAAERVQNLTQILELQSALDQHGLGAGYMVEPQHVYNAVADVTRAIAIAGGSPDRYFANPMEKGPPPPPPPPPEVIKEENQNQDRQASRQLEAQDIQRHTAADKELAEFRHVELAHNMKLEEDKLAQQERLKMAEIESRERIEIAKAHEQRLAAEATARASQESSDVES